MYGKINLSAVSEKLWGYAQAHCLAALIRLVQNKLTEPCYVVGSLRAIRFTLGEGSILRVLS